MENYLYGELGTVTFVRRSEESKKLSTLTLQLGRL